MKTSFKMETYQDRVWRGYPRTATQAVQALWDMLPPGFRWDDDFDVLYDIAEKADAGEVTHRPFVRPRGD